MRRIKLTQYIPMNPAPMFEVINFDTAVNYWHVKIQDVIDDGGPEYRLAVPKKSKAPLTAQQIANAAAGELTEATGTITMTLWLNGLPTLSAIYVANGRQVLCVWSTDPIAAPVEHPAILDPTGWRRKMAKAFKNARIAQNQRS